MDEWLARAAVVVEGLSNAWVQAPEHLGFPPEWILYAAVVLYVAVSIMRSRARARETAASPAAVSKDFRQAAARASSAAASAPPAPYADLIRDKPDLASFMDAMANNAQPVAPKTGAAPRRLDVGRLAQPPRGVSPALAVRVLLGGMQQIGWAVFGVGMMFAWTFAGNAEVAWSLRAGALGQAQAQVIESFDAGAQVNDVSVYGTRFVFEASGRSIEGSSYANGRSLQPGDSAAVEYALSDPEHARIVGMRSALFGPVVLLVLIFPGIGLLMIVLSLRARLRDLRLLRHGVAAFGRLVEKRPTNMTVNNRQVYELFFEFKTRDGRTATARSTTSLTADLEDEAEEALLYDPLDPAGAVMFDAIPGCPEISPDGTFSGGGGALAVLILPVLALGGHGWWAWLKWVA